MNQSSSGALTLLITLAVSASIFRLSPVRADVVVIANRSREAVPFSMVLGGEPAQSMTVASGRQRVIPHPGQCLLLYEMSGELVRYQLDANSVYFFAHNQQGWLELSKIDLGGEQAEDVPADGNGSELGGPAAQQTATPARGPAAEIPVKILVDNREPTPRTAWEPRLRGRIDRVSALLQAQCGLRLNIVAVDTWDSGNLPIDLQQSFSDFRQHVDPHPARLAIGFTGRYQQDGGRVDLGSTHGMLQSHILIRERADTMSEPERDEVLLHEIGHYLGAVHSPDPTSVMRPMLADDKAIHRDFQIGFDPVNTLIINLVAEDMSRRAVETIADLSPRTRQRLSEIYGVLANAVPDDKSARQFLFQLGAQGDTPLVQATRLVVREVRQAAQSRQLAARNVDEALAADKLTDYYVRRGATLAMTLPNEVAPAALILGLGIALDDSDTLLRTKLTRDFSRQVETEQERRERRGLLGHPTVRGRRDLAQHFFLSAYLTAVVGAPAAESAGLAKEMADSHTSSGFSYRDLAADTAGIEFARRLIGGRLTLPQVAAQFTVADLMPEVDDLPEGVPWNDIRQQLQGTDPGSLSHYRREILRRIRLLPQSQRGAESE